MGAEAISRSRFPLHSTTVLLGLLGESRRPKEKIQCRAGPKLAPHPAGAADYIHSE